MIAKAVRIIHPEFGEIEEHDSFRVGGDYLVLEVSFEPKGCHLRLLDEHALRYDGGIPGVWSAAMFEIVSPRISRTWETAIEHLDGGTYVTFAPREWLRPGFWEDYIDRAWEGAGDAFKRAVVEMAAEEGVALPAHISGRRTTAP